MEDMLASLSTYGYLILFFYSFGGGFVALMAAAVLSYAGEMNIYLSIAVAFTANFIGDQVLFYLGRYNKSDMMGYLKNHRRKLALSHLLMKKYGDKAIFFQKYVYGIKTLIPIAIGLTKYSFLRFSIFNLFAAALWALVVGFGSYIAGASILKTVSHFTENPIIAPIIIFTLLGGIWFYLSKATAKS